MLLSDTPIIRACSLTNVLVQGRGVNTDLILQQKSTYLEENAVIHMLLVVRVMNLRGLLWTQWRCAFGW